MPRRRASTSQRTEGASAAAVTIKSSTRPAQRVRPHVAAIAAPITAAAGTAMKKEKRCCRHASAKPSRPKAATPAAAGEPRQANAIKSTGTSGSAAECTWIASQASDQSGRVSVISDSSPCRPR